MRVFSVSLSILVGGACTGLNQGSRDAGPDSTAVNTGSGGNNTGGGGNGTATDGGPDVRPGDGGLGGAGGDGLGGGAGMTTGAVGGMGGMLSPAVLAIDPTSKDLSTVTIGRFAEATFQVSNTGGAATSVPTVSLDGTDAAQYAVTTNGCTAAIAGGASCLVTVRFTPTAVGLKAARLNVRATLGGAVTAMLQGSGVAQGALTITPANQGLGSIQVGQRSAASTFTVTNTGGSATGMLATTISDSTELAIMSNGCQGMTLAPAATCTITVTLAPTSPGPKSATLSVTATPGGTASSGLTGTGLAPAELVISPTNATLPTTVVNGTSAVQVFTVTNAGGVAAGGTVGLAVAIGGTAPEFAITATTCTTPTLAPAASCTVSVAFKPTSPGPKAATVVASATPGTTVSAALAGTALSPAALTLDPASGASPSFGTVVTGGSSSQTFTVSNAGQQASSPLTLAVTGSADFTISAPTTGDCVSGTTTLAAGASCTIHLRFAPTVAGEKSAAIAASATTGGSRSVALSGTAVTPGAITIGPTSRAFDPILQGTTSSTATTFTVTNTGGTATGTLSTSVTGSTEFTVMTDNCRTRTLAPAATCTILVVFAPATGGQKTGTLAVAATPGGNAAANLSGVGLTPADLVLSPATLTFPAGTVSGTTSTAQTFTVTNSGGVASGVVTATLLGTNANQFSIASNTCTSLAAGGTCAIGVTFKPTTDGSKTATLSVSATPGDTATSAITAVAILPAKLAVAVATGSPATLGQVVMGQSSLQTFVVSNTGQQTTSAVTVTVAGTDFALVTPVQGDCTFGATPITLVPAASCTVSVRFTPTGAVARTGTLTATATTGGTASAALSGTGVAPSALAISPTTQTFGSVQQTIPSGSHSFIVTNTGGVATGALSTSVTGASATEFGITSNGCNGTALPAMGTCTITVVMTPASPGNKSATLNVTATGGTSAAATLTGAGLAPALLTVSPASFTFATTVVGSSSAAQAFTVTNTGGVTAGTTTGLTATLGGTNSTEFILANGCPTTLVGGGTCTFSVTFHPLSGGIGKSAMVTIGASPGNTVVLSPLTGNAQTAAALALAGTADFGTVATDTNRQQTFTVTNTGQQTSGALTVGLTGSDFALVPVGTTPCASGVTTLAGGTSCTIGVRFAPTATGARTGRLTVSATPGSSPVVNLTGNGKLPTGTFSEFAVPPNEDVALTGLAIGPDRNLYFCQGTLWRLSLQPGSLGTVAFVPGGFPSDNSPFEVAVGADGNFWMTEFGPANVARLSPSGTGFAEFPLAAPAPLGAVHIISGPDSNLWFTESRTGGGLFLRRITTAGTQLANIPVGAFYLAAGADGNVWATENGNNRIARITTAGVVTEFPIPTAGSSPFGIAAGPDGNIWFAETGANKIARFNISTLSFTEFPIPTAAGTFAVRYITAGPDGNLWFAEPTANQMARITTAGVITEFPVPTAGALPLEVIAGPDGLIYFTEQSANAIGRISP